MEYALNRIGILNMVWGKFVNQELLEALGTRAAHIMGGVEGLSSFL